MNSSTRIVFGSLLLLGLVGCASTQVTQRAPDAGPLRIARPDHIYVYPFAVTPADAPSWSVAAQPGSLPGEPLTPEALERGRKLGRLVAQALIEEIGKMGLSAVEGQRQSLPEENDLMLVGYFEEVEAGSAPERVFVGFGSGAVELRTVVDGYQMTQEGPRLLGESKLRSRGGKGPGLMIPVLVAAATVNPIPLFVLVPIKLGMELLGGNQLEAAATQTAKTIAESLRIRFENQAWID
jgi:hypothetical protein